MFINQHKGSHYAVEKPNFKGKSMKCFTLLLEIRDVKNLHEKVNVAWNLS